ncbi:hypothetical protein CA13_30310 [Planctomycetes bacterium CA13]|uniref:Uncharacterized protein n=1 Tax=Novipirellula herctigrandis TaxID=2527986 RepID=A0A5C5Z2M6_9BACT|nr:hypothetical protein CA13_30310 [Planctomycetes bacterium CA13]
MVRIDDSEVMRGRESVATLRRSITSGKASRTEPVSLRRHGVFDSQRELAFHAVARENGKIVARELHDHSQSDVATENVAELPENVNTVKKLDELLLKIVGK